MVKNRIPTDVEVEQHRLLMADFRAYCDGKEPNENLANLFALTIESHKNWTKYGLRYGLNHAVIAEDLLRSSWIFK